MAWIELHQAVWTHRKTFELAATLGLDETYAAAHLIRLWTWALDNAPDGDLSKLSDRAIAFGAGWRHEVSLFVRALAETGWLDDNRGIHDWNDYAGRLIERREKDAERKKIARMSGGPAPDVHRTSNGTAAGVRRTGPNRTGPDLNRTGPDPLPPTPSPHGGEGDGLTKITAFDRKLWKRARERLRDTMNQANWELLVEPLEPLGRTSAGGLCLRAPPEQGIARRIKTAAQKALVDVGEPSDAAKLITIVEHHI